VDRDRNGEPTSARAQFHKRAGEYAVSRPHASGESLIILSQLASEHRYERAVDIATGPGFTAFAVAPYCGRVLATDVARGMLEQVWRLRSERGLDNVDVSHAAAEALPFRDGSFDLATCRTAPHHFRNVPLFVSETARVLASSGTFLLVDTNAPEDRKIAAWQHEMECVRDPSHVRNLSESEWKQALTDAGFDVESSVEARVELNLNDWANRSGTGAADFRHLREAWGNASPAVVEAFRIAPQDDGNFSFSWPCMVARALKTNR